MREPRTASVRRLRWAVLIAAGVIGVVAMLRGNWLLVVAMFLLVFAQALTLRLERNGA